MVKQPNDFSKFLIVYFFFSSIIFCQLHIENIDEYLKKPVIVELTTGEKLNGHFILKRDIDYLFQTDSGKRVIIKTEEIRNVELDKLEQYKRVLTTFVTISCGILVYIVLYYFGIIIY